MIFTIVDAIWAAVRWLGGRAPPHGAAYRRPHPRANLITSPVHRSLATASSEGRHQMAAKPPIYPEGERGGVARLARLPVLRP